MGAPELRALKLLSHHQEEDITYYDAKADAELVSVPTFAVEDREQPEPCLAFWATTVSAV